MCRVSERCVVHPQVIADSPNDYDSRVQADAQPDLETSFLFQLLAVATDGLLDREGGLNTAPGVILDREGAPNSAIRPSPRN